MLVYDILWKRHIFILLPWKKIDFGDRNLMKPYFPNQLLTLQRDAQLLWISKHVLVYDKGHNELSLSHARLETSRLCDSLSVSLMNRQAWDIGFDVRVHSKDVCENRVSVYPLSSGK